jgi:hypothetical protein
MRHVLVGPDCSATSHILSQSILGKDIPTELDCSPTCFRFAVLSQRKPVTSPTKRLKHEGHESRDAPPALDSDVDVDSLSDFSGNGDAVEASSSCENAVVGGRRRIATTAVRFTRIPHSLSFAHICGSPFRRVSRSSVGFHSFPGTGKVAILDIVPTIGSFIHTPSLVHDCIHPFRAHRVLPTVNVVTCETYILPLIHVCSVDHPSLSLS